MSQLEEETLWKAGEKEQKLNLKAAEARGCEE